MLEEVQDELQQAVAEGAGAGTACARVLDGCVESRARLLLGSQYHEDMEPHKLEALQVGYSDAWSLHTDVDGSVYWFNKASMRSVKEPPPGWAKDGNTWVYVAPAERQHAVKEEV